jgi:purine nucleosidase
MSTRPILIDCDPGVDDAIALLLAFASPELHLLGITTVAGNVPLALTQTNARRICELAKRTEIPVYAGCPRPLLRPLETAAAIHGETGLQGIELPEPQMPLQPQHAVDFLIETLMAAADQVTIATLGPLTNLAVALIQAPQIAGKISELVLMGGAIGHGNVTPTAEFNIYVDPHAAHVVFSSGIKLTMIGLDVTHQVLTTPARQEAIRSINTPVGKTATALLESYGEVDRQRYGLAGSPLHDPCVIAYVLHPELFTCRAGRVAIETTSALTLGQTVVDFRSPLLPNASVACGVDAPAIYQLLIDRLSRL